MLYSIRYSIFCSFKISVNEQFTIVRSYVVLIEVLAFWHASNKSAKEKRAVSAFCLLLSSVFCLLVMNVMTNFSSHQNRSREHRFVRGTMLDREKRPEAQEIRL